MTVDRTDPRPAYAQIADHLRDTISRGDVRDGDQLPSESQLIEQFGTSSGPVRRAIAQLKAEGLIVARQGAGVFVRRRRPLYRYRARRQLGQTRPADTAPLEAEATAQGFTHAQELLEVTTAPAPTEVAEHLAVETGTQVLVRRYRLLLDKEPFALADSYFPAELVEGTSIASAERIGDGVHADLEADLGVELSHCVEELQVRMPVPAETRALRLLPGTPIVKLLRTVFSTDGRPVEVTDWTIAGDRQVFVYEVPAR